MRDYGHSQNTSYVLGLIKAVNKVTRESELLDDLDAINRDPGNNSNHQTSTHQCADRQSGPDRSSLRMGEPLCGDGCHNAQRNSRISHQTLETEFNSEKLDSADGLPLIANLDALFDSGLMTFSDDGALLVSPCMT